MKPISVWDFWLYFGMGLGEKFWVWSRPVTVQEMRTIRLDLRTCNFSNDAVTVQETLLYSQAVVTVREP